MDVSIFSDGLGKPISVRLTADHDLIRFFIRVNDINFMCVSIRALKLIE